jgi:hypothetical protein
MTVISNIIEIKRKIKINQKDINSKQITQIGQKGQLVCR